MNRIRRLLPLLFAMCLGYPAGATQFIYVNQNVPGTTTLSGASWANAYPELRQALQSPAVVSASLNSPVEIWVAAGTYKPTSDNVRSKSFAVPSYVTIRGGFVGTETSPAQRPSSGAWTVLSGDIGTPDPTGITSANIGGILAGSAPAPNISSGIFGSAFNDNSYNVVTCEGVSNVVLDGLIITGGDANNTNASGQAVHPLGDLAAMTWANYSGTDSTDAVGSPLVQPDPVVAGGGIFVSNYFARPANQSTMALVNCVLIHNAARNMGGGMAAFEANLSFSGCSFLNNFACAEGGAFAGMNQFSSFENCGFSNNTAIEFAGAVYYSTIPSVKTVQPTVTTAQQAAVMQSVGTGIALVISSGKYAMSKLDNDGSPGVFDSFNFQDFIDGDPETEALTTVEDSLAPTGFLDAYSLVGIAVTAGNFIGDLSIALGGDANSPAYQGYLQFSDFFGEYLSPIGVLGLISQAFGGDLGSLLHQPSFEDEQNQYMQTELLNYNAAPYSTMKDCTFLSNNVWGEGGAAVVQYDNVEFDRCWFLNNGAVATGGALGLLGWNTPRVFNCAFSGNDSSSGFSAIYNSFHTRPQIIYCTFTGNIATKAVALGCELGASVKLANSILWNNTSSANPKGGADIYVSTSQNLTGNALSAYQQAGPGRNDYVATMDMRFCTVQSFNSLPQGAEQFELYPWNADSSLVSVSEQYYQQADMNGFADLAGYCNLGEGIRPGAFEVLDGANIYDNNADEPILVGKGGVVPVSFTPALSFEWRDDETLYAFSSAFKPLPIVSFGSTYEGQNLDGFFTGSDTFSAQMNEAPFTDIFGVGAGVLGTTDRGCVQYQGQSQQGVQSNNGNATANSIYYVRSGAPPNGDGLTWATAFSDFSRLLNEAELFLPFPVWVAQGSYDITGLAIPNGQFYGGFVGNETNVNQSNPASHPTYLSGSMECNGAILMNGFILANNHSQYFPLISGQDDTAVITNCAFINDSAGYGGTIYWLGPLNLYNSTFVGNSSTGNGGAIYANEVTAQNCLFASNSASYQGGAIWFADYAEIINCLFDDNNAGAGGSAIFGDEGGGGAWHLYSDTFYGNGFLTVSIGGDLPNPVSPTSVLGPTPAAVNCLFWNNASDGTTIQQFSGIASDPYFLDPDYGNFELSASSPAIGAGQTGSLPANFPVTDLAGQPRFVNGRLDLGAYEFQGSPASPPAFSTELSQSSGLQNGVWDRTYSFTVALGGSALPTGLQWQVNTGNGTWTAIANGSLYQGVNGLTLTVSNPSLAMNGYQYRLTGVANSASFALPPVGLEVLQRVIYVDGARGFQYATNVFPTGVSPTWDGLSWATAFPTLPEAFALAQPGMEIWVRAGTYYPLRRLGYIDNLPLPQSLSLVDGVRVLGGFNGAETSAAQRNWHTNVTILTGNMRGTVDDPDLDHYIYAPSPSIFVNGPGMSSNAVLDGFTLIQATNGAIVNLGASPTIDNCMFVSNTAPAGAAIGNWSGASPQLIDCAFSDNLAQQGALYFSGSAGLIENCLLYGNQALSTGGAIFATNSSLSLVNSALVFNSATGLCGGLDAGGGSNSIVNSILWGNEDGVSGPNTLGAQLSGSAPTGISYSCVQGGATANENLTTDPVFNLTASNDFHLSSSSPLINAGNGAAAPLNVDLEGSARESNGLVDIGPYEHQATPGGPLLVTNLPYSLAVTNLGVYSFVVSGSAIPLTGLQWQVNTGSGFGPVTNTALLNYGATVSNNSATLSLYLTNVSSSYNSLNGSEYRFVIPGLNVTSPPSMFYVRVPLLLLVNSQASGARPNGLTWATAYTNIAQALNPTNQYIAEIWVAQGTYTLPAAVTSPVYGGFAGGETLRAQRNWTSHPTVLSAGATVAGVLDGFVVHGTLQASYAAPTIQNCVLSGAGDMIYVNFGQVTISNCVFSNANYGVFMDTGVSALIANSTFTGGLNYGVYLGTACNVAVSNCMFSGISTGIESFGVGTQCAVSRSTFQSNSVAGVVDEDDGSLTVRDSLFANNNCVSINHAPDSGDSSSTTVINCTLVANRQPEGAITATSGGALTVMNCILWNNYSSNWNNTLTSLFPASIVSAYAGSELNGIYTTHVNNYVLDSAWSNYEYSLGLPFEGETYAVWASSELADKAYYNETVADSCVAGLSYFGGNGNTASDPLFVNAPANNFLPITLSPMLNAGNSSVVNAGELDLAGNPRLFGPAVDIGAYELQIPSAGVIAVAQGPQSLTASTPGSASFVAEMGANSYATNFVWQINTGGGWMNIAANAPFTISATVNSAILEIAPVDLSMNGDQFRLAAPQVSFATAPATLTVMPGSMTGAVRGSANTTAVLGSGTNAGAYVWQVNNGSGWVNLTNGGSYAITYSGNSSALAISALGLAQNGFQYRFVAPDGSYTSLPSTLTITVPTQLYVSASATGSANGFTWNNAFTRLQDALAATLPGQQIWVAAGTYQATNNSGAGAPWELAPGTVVYGGFQGNETSLGQRNWSSNICLLLPGTNSPIMSNQVLQADATSVLDGFYLTGGNGQPALVNNSVSPVIQNCAFTGNSASAVSNVAAPGNFNNCVFAGNVGPGSAFFQSGSPPIVANCVFSNNAATNGGGGAVYITGGGGQFNTCQFLSNSAAGNGGAVAAPNANGGLAMPGCVFSGNISASNGGAMFVGGPVRLFLNYVTFTGNSAVNGGGLFTDPALVQAQLESCLLAQNYATNNGGGMEWQQANVYNSFPLLITSCTFADNSAGGDGGGFWGDDPSVFNSIFWGNTGAATGQSAEFQQLYNPNFVAALQSGRSTEYLLSIYNCIVQGLDLYNQTNQNLNFSVYNVADNLALDPVFLNAAAGQFEPQPFSPAINAGGQFYVTPQLDLVGNARVYGPAMDIGAYELQADETAPLQIVSLPSSATACDGTYATFGLTTATPMNITNLIWQINTGGGFTTLPPSAPYSVSLTATSTVLTVNPATTDLNGYQFRLAVAGYQYTTPPSVLTVNPPPIAYVNPAATGNGSGTNWANAFTNLAQAMNGDSCLQLWVAQGSYVIPVGGNGATSFRMRQYLDMEGGFAGNETTLAARDYAHHPTILLAANGQSIFFNDGTAGAIDHTAVLDGFVLSGAAVNPAIFNIDASPQIRNCVFTNNLARAVYNLGITSGSQGTFTNCLFVNNPEGAILNQFSAPGIFGCVFSGNNSASRGAAIDNEQGGPAIIGCSFWRNSAGLGAAVYNNSTNAGSLVLRCQFATNSAREGGAIYNTFGSALSVRDSLLAQNGASTQGGAISDYGLLGLTNCTVADNMSGTAAGGLWIDSRGTLAVENSIIWGNAVNTPGASVGLAQINGGSGPALLNSVFTSIVEGLSGGPANNDLPYDPLFVNESTGNYHLTSDSPALDAANVNSVPNGDLDLDGNPRVTRSSVDLGAYEFQGVAMSPATVSLVPQSVGVCASNNVVFTVAAPATNGFTYVWQQLGGGVFTNLTSDGLYAISASGGNGTLSVLSVPASLDGSSYRVLLQGASVTSTSAVFTLNVALRSVIYVNSHAAPGGNGSSWSNALLNLADAVGQGTCDDIWIAAGTYAPTNDSTGLPVTLALQQGMRLFGGFAGTETSLSQRNAAVNRTVLMATSGAPVLEAIGGGVPMDASTVVDGLTVIGGGNAPAVLISSASPLIQNCVFTTNNQGAIASQVGAAPSIVNCVFSNNTGFASASATGASPSFVNCVFAGNQTGSGQNGGAIDVEGGSSISVGQCVFSNNATGGAGGAVFVNQSSASVSSSLIVNNSANTGGAIAGTGATVFLVNDTVAQNTASVVGGVSISGAAYITNSILWNNGPGEASQLAGTVVAAYSCIQGLNQFTGNNNIAYDPLFVNPSAGIFTLQTGSPAVDTGDDAAAPAGLDLAGGSRLQGFAVDMGAYESAGIGSYIEIIQQPVSQTICQGQTVLFAAAGPANFGTNFNWQVNEGAGFVALPTGAGYNTTADNAASTLTITNPSVGLNGYQYRAQIGSLALYSSTATLTVLRHSILYVNAAATGSQSGGDWTNAYTGLDAALAAASPCVDIWVAGGVYAPAEPAGGGGFALPPGTSLYGGFAGVETNLTQRNWTNHPTLLVSSGQTNVVQCLIGSAPESPVALLDGFTITSSNGGGLFAQEANPTLRNCAFTSNSGPAVVNAGGAPWIQNCVFSSNSFTAIVNENGGSVTVTNSQFLGNNSPGPGGAILSQNAGLLVSRSFFAGNTALLGGAICDSANCPAVVLDHCVFATNSASEEGGAIYNGQNCGLSVINCLIDSNAALEGGGLANYAQLSVLSTTIYGNAATVAGSGCYSPQGFGGITNSILWGNSLTPQSGGSLALSQLQGSLNASFSIVQGGGAFDPQFVNPASGNFNLAAYSPAIGAGYVPAATNIATDLNFNPRVSAWGVDLGAYESGSAPESHAVSISSSPASQSACAMQGSVEFAFTAAINGPLQWQVNNGGGWQAINPSSTGAPGLVGETYFTTVTTNGVQATSTLTVSNILPALNGFQYAVSDGISFTSAPAVLAVIQPTTIYVNAAAPGGDGGSWSNAFNNLGAAINALTTCDRVIWVAAGTYYPATNDSTVSFAIPSSRVGLQILGGFNGGETNLAQRNWATNITILSGMRANSSAVVSFNGSSGVIDTNTVLDGFTITGGQTGVKMALASPLITHCAIESNSAGGVVVSDGSPVLLQDEFLANAGISGGGLSVVSNTLPCAPLLQDCVFRGNTAVTGGAIYSFNTDATLLNCLVSGNAAVQSGGGVELSEGVVSVINSTITGNATTAVSGGGLDASGASANIVNSILWNNGSSGANTETAQISGSASVASSAAQGLNLYAGHGNIGSDPLFVSPVLPAQAPTMAGDFHLFASSPELAAGNPAAVAFVGSDLDGNLRLSDGGAVDMGAYEFEGTPTTRFVVSNLPGSVSGFTANSLVLQANAIGAGLSYQWELSLNGQAWVVLTNGSVYSGTTTPTLSISNLTYGLLGAAFRVVVTDQTGASSVSTPTALALHPSTWYVNASAAPNGDGRTWATALQDLRQTLTNVVLGPSNLQIWVAAGTYYPSTNGDTNASFALPSNLAVIGGFNGSETNVNQRDWTANPTVLEGALSGGGNSSSLVSAFGVTNATLDGLILQDASTGVTNIGSPLVVVNCSFSNLVLAAGLTNASGSFSNCAFSSNSMALEIVGGNPIVQNCLFTANTGAVVSDINSSPTLTDCVFINNPATVLYNGNGSLAYVNGCAFGQNGIGAYNDAGSAPVFEGCAFTNNTHGLYNNQVSDGLVTVEDCQFLANHDSAIYNDHSDAVIARSVFRGNSTPNLGGAVYDTGFVWAYESLFSGNYAGQGGGAMYLESYSIYSGDTGAIDLQNCTIAGNGSGGTGAGLLGNCQQIDLTVQNSIFWGNYSAASGQSVDAQIWIPPYSADFYPDHDDVQGLDLENYGTLNPLNADPLFVQPAPGGGAEAPTLAGDYHLGGASRLIGNGINYYLNTGSGFGLNFDTDLDGNPLVVNGVIGRGAYNFQGTPSPNTLSLTGNPSPLVYYPGVASHNQFIVTAAGANLTYQWYGNFNDGSGFVMLANGTNFQGVTTSTLMLLNDSSLVTSAQYLAVVASPGGAGEVYSQPATVTVNPTQWYVNAAASAGGDGLSWATAFNDLNLGLNNPRLTPAASQIWVAGGTYANGPFVLTNGVAFLGGFAGNETDASQRNWVANPTVLTSAGDWTLESDGSPVDGFIIKNPYATGLYYSSAGGLDSNTVANCTFVMGTGGYGIAAGDSMMVSNCQFFGGYAGLTMGSYGRVLNCAFSNYVSGGLACYMSNDVENCSFNGGVSALGSEPVGALVSGMDGNIYGVANPSIFFRVAANGVIIPVYDGNTDSETSRPYLDGPLTVGGDGNFYGLAYLNNFVVAVRMTTNGSVSLLGPQTYDGGLQVTSPMVQATNGSFYGLAANVLFEANSNGLTILNNLDTLAGNPRSNGGLVQGPDGNLYGTAYSGGGNNAGAIFKMTPAGVVSILYSFGSGTAPNSPAGSLVLGNDGQFYGATSSGGDHYAGVIFRVSLAGTITTLYSFTGNLGFPIGSLAVGPDGAFYGQTEYESNVVFRVDTNGVFTTLHTFGANGFNSQNYPLDGETPSGGLTLGGDGNFYGAMQQGGSNNAGVLFSITPAGQFSVLTSFSGNQGALVGISDEGGMNVFHQCQFSNNAYGLDLSAISGEDQVLDCSISGNLVGGITGSSSGGSLLVAGCVINGNNGPAVSFSGPMNLNVNDSLIAGNAGGLQAGAIDVGSNEVSIVNSTITGNTSGRSVGGLSNPGGMLQVSNSIFWNNFGTNGGTESDQIAAGAADQYGYDCIQGISAGGGNVSQDPIFVQQVAAGLAPTMAGDYHLQSFSPLIGAGQASAAVDQTDLDGNPRTVNGGVDLGAYEFQGVPSPSTILQSPTNIQVVRGQTIYLSVTVSGPAPGYQWLFNGGAITNATNAFLTIPNAAYSEAGSYQVKIANLYATVPAIVTVIDPNFQAPTNTQVMLGQTLYLSVTITGPPPGYQWLFNGGAITNATNAFLIIPDATCAEAGSYQVQMSNLYPNLYTSAPAIVTVVDTNLPIFAVNLTNTTRTAPVASALTLSVSMAANCNAETYQWYLNGNNALSGQTNAALVITNVLLANAGSYSVTVSNPNGAVTSQTEVVVVPIPVPTIATAGIQLGAGFHLRIVGVTNTSCFVLASTNLITWQNIGPATVSGPGLFDFVDTNYFRYPHRYYRLQEPSISPLTPTITSIAIPPYNQIYYNEGYSRTIVITIAGTGTAYILQTSSDLAHWADSIYTPFTQISPGVFQCQTSSGISQPQTFYRVRLR